MTIKKKIVSIFLLLLSSGLFPFSFITISKIKTEAIANLQDQSKIYAYIFSKAIVNSLFMNGGDIDATAVDTKELMSIFSPLREYGLAQADVIFLSANQSKNGTVINKNFLQQENPSYGLPKSKLSNSEIRELLYFDGSFRERGDEKKFFEFIKSAGLTGKAPLCLVRFTIDKDIALKNVERLKKYLFLSSSIILILSIALAFFLGGFISKPIISLTEKAERLKNGQYSARAEISSKDEIGELAATFNNMAEIIEEKIAELEKANIELQELDRLKDEFLANTSHELKTPVHGILGLTESLLDGTFGELNEKSKHILSMIAKSSRRLASLVNDILDFSKLKNNDVDLSIRDLDLSSVAEAVVTILRPLAKEKEIDLLNKIPSGVFVKADESRLEQILINLVGNAIKFTHKGFVHLESSTSDDRIIVSIIDTGTGIPEEKQQKIFESFFQADGSETRGYSGIGLGLAITKKLVNLHGGELWFKTKVGEGTVFHFSIPVGKPQADSSYSINKTRKNFYDTDSTPVINVPSRSLTGAKILVVDDEPINLQILLNQLSKNNYNVKVATNGKDALEAIEKNEEFDLILLDVMMPEISGFEVCKRIREKFSPHELPVVLLTAKNTREDIITGLSLGANDYITKPFDREELLARVKNYIALKKAAEEQKRFLILKQELEIAKSIQLTILPEKLPSIEKLTINAKYEPMMEIGGDFYDFIVLDEKRIGVLIADVTGHGVSAALIASMIKVALHMSYKFADNPAMMLTNLNSSLHDHIYGRFITALYIFINTEEMTLTFSNAAHWPFYIHNRESNKITEHTVRGRLIGLNSDGNFQNSTVRLNNHDRIIIFTDGIIEERNFEGNSLGETNLVEIIKAAATKKPARLLDDIFLKLYDWSSSANKESLEDDATLIVIDVNL
jgi:two-component system sensor histidine kinase ChiS